MTETNVLLLRGFLEDEPASTSVYADGLYGALRNQAAFEFIINKYTPKMLMPARLQNVWGMRFARYFLYPFQVPPRKKKIIHLLDHRYAHFLYARNPGKTIVTVTDLMPVLWWKKLLPVNSKKGVPITVLYSLYALKRATHIITISLKTKNNLVKLIGCDPSKISVIHLGVDSIFKPYDPELKKAQRIRLFGADPKRLLLITGSQFYKNHETALKILASLHANGYKNIYLVKTGNSTQEWLELVEKYGLINNVINLGFIPRQQMPDLYNAVDVLLFPSLYEGFGWPPLEAMACGTPALTSNAASLPEVMGAVDNMYDPFDSFGFAQKIDSLFNNQDYRLGVIQQGISQSAKFSWEQTARKTMDVYNLVEKNIIER